MHVVEHEDERSRLRRVSEQQRDRIEEPKASALGLENGRSRQVRERLSELGEKLRQIGGPRTELFTKCHRLLRPDVCSQRLHPGPVSRRSARFPGAAEEGSRAASAGAVGELLDEATLADPRFAGDEDEAATARERVLERPEQLGELAAPPDEWRRGRPRARTGAAAERRAQVERVVLAEDGLLELL